MICLVHGYALTGSGSNQWTRSIAQGMVETGETIHLICQEHRPEQLDFVSEAWTYDPDGRPNLLFRRSIDRPGRCIVHRPVLELLPTYVRPKASVTSMAAILDLAPPQIEEYLRRNEAAMRRIFRDHAISCVHVNHVVLMAVVVHRVCQELAIPYAIMPHGSAIEYVVKHSPEMKQLAGEALASADRILMLSEEMIERIRNVFDGLANPESKMIMASAGVDTSRFRVIGREERGASIEQLKDDLAGAPRGKSPDLHRVSVDDLADDLSLDAVQNLLRGAGDYPPKAPDIDLEAKLDTVDWERDEIIIFVGKIIGYKGLPSIVAAFPEIASRRPHARLIIAGRGNLREGLEALIAALGAGKRSLVERLVTWGSALEGEPPQPFDRIASYFGQLKASGRLDAYFEAARRHVHLRSIILTGYLEHHLLCHLFPCCDVAIFPSIVKEAAPLVVPEAMASGCFPIGTDYAGMGASLDVAGQAVPEDVAAFMRLRPEAEHTVLDIVEHVSNALEVSDTYRHDLRDLALRKYDWRSVAARLAGELHGMRT